MYLIVGLGNPDVEYENTRHNMGFNVIDKLAKDCDIKISQSKFKGIYKQENINGEKVIFLKPQTYMNLSGESIIQFKNFYKIPEEQIIVIYDDIDLEPGTIRIRKKGGPGTHNGMKSVVNCLQTENFIRIRVGIGKPKYKDDMINYVIGAIPEGDKQKLKEGINKAAEAVMSILEDGIDIAMNKFNGKEK